MKVKAKWNVKDGSGWHCTGEVFETESDLGDAVEILDAPKKQEPVKKAEPEKEPETVKAVEPASEPSKPKTPSRRKSK